jgi:hypothetical protein
MKKNIFWGIMLSTLAVVLAHGSAGASGFTYSRLVSVFIDFLMVTLFVLWIICSSSHMKSTSRVAFFLLPCYLILMWLLWLMIWIPVDKLAGNCCSELAIYSAFSYRFVAMYALSAGVVALALPGIWWWRKGSSRGIFYMPLFMVHVVVSIFIALLAFGVSPTYR